MRPTVTNSLVTLNILGIIDTDTEFYSSNNPNSEPNGLIHPRCMHELVIFVHTSLEIAIQVHTPPLLVTMAVYEG